MTDRKQVHTYLHITTEKVENALSIEHYNSVFDNDIYMQNLENIKIPKTLRIHFQISAYITYIFLCMYVHLLQKM